MGGTVRNEKKGSQSQPDELGHFAVEKTINKLKKLYCFLDMRWQIFHKVPKDKQEGFLNPLNKNTTLFHTFHIDHLGQFNIRSVKK